MKFGDYDVYAQGLLHSLPAEVLAQFADAIAENYLPTDVVMLVFKDVYDDGTPLFTWLPITAHPTDYTESFSCSN